MTWSKDARRKAAEDLRVAGEVSVALDGAVVHRTRNLVTAQGRSHVVARMVPGSTEPAMCAIAIGTGVPGGAALGAELKRRSFRTSILVGGVLTLTVQWQAEDAFAATITEAGIFNSSAPGGTMIASARLAAVAKGTYDTLQLTWTLRLL